jgi:hypothetical protein
MSDVATLRDEGRELIAAGRVPEAVVAFRSAERLAPWDGETRADAAAVRALVGDVPPPSSFADRVGPIDVAVVAFFAILTLVVGVYRFRVRQDRRWLGLAASGVVAIIVLSLLTRPRESSPFAVVAVERTTLREGNADRYDAISTSPVSRGHELAVLGERGGWLRVRTNGGDRGWVSESSVIRANR